MREEMVAPSPVVVARPFVKWAGGKGQMLEQYRSLWPKTFGRYHEPFLGGGAVFFDLGRPDAWLADANDELVNAYRVVRDGPEALLRALQWHADQHSEEHYYEVRGQDPQNGDVDFNVRRAARFLYLNRTCFNGLYRVNRKGQFNVPMGDYKNPRIVDEENIRAVSRRLEGCAIECCDYRKVETLAHPGDLVYFDPPYDVSSKTARFTAFTPLPFGWKEQQELHACFDRLSMRGVKCVLSNADTERVRELYRDYDVRTVGARRAINSAADKRGTISEVVVLSYDPEGA